MGPEDQLPVGMSRCIDEFQIRFRNVVSKGVQLVHTSLPHETGPLIIYTGMTFPSCVAMDVYLNDVQQNGFMVAASFTSGLPVASRFTNTDLPPSTTFAVRLLKQGFNLPKPTVGLLCILDGFCHRSE